MAGFHVRRWGTELAYRIYHSAIVRGIRCTVKEEVSKTMFVFQGPSLCHVALCKPSMPFEYPTMHTPSYHQRPPYMQKKKTGCTSSRSAKYIYTHLPYFLAPFIPGFKPVPVPSSSQLSLYPSLPAVSHSEISSSSMSAAASSSSGCTMRPSSRSSPNTPCS